MRHDCHMHMVLDGIDWRAAIGRHSRQANEDFVRRVLAEYRDKGYSYLRDGGDRWGVGKLARSLAGEYGIVYRTPLAPLCKKGHYGAFIGETYENLREYTDLVKKIRKNGGDFVKIMISGLMDFNRFGVLTELGLERAEVLELVHIAHSEGFAVMAHCNGARTAEAAAEAGVDSIEHGAYLDRDALAAMKENGVVWVPTLSTVGNLQGKGRFEETAVRKILRSSMENLRLFAGMGGLIACGSDAGAWAVPHGCHTEMQWLLQVTDEETVAKGNGQIIKRF